MNGPSDNLQMIRELNPIIEGDSTPCGLYPGLWTSIADSKGSRSRPDVVAVLLPQSRLSACFFASYQLPAFESCLLHVLKASNLLTRSRCPELSGMIVKRAKAGGLG